MQCTAACYWQTALILLVLNFFLLLFLWKDYTEFMYIFSIEAGEIPAGRERERESALEFVCVCVCERGRERESALEFVCVCV